MTRENYEDRIHELLGSIRTNTEGAILLKEEWLIENKVIPQERKEIMYQLYNAVRHWHRNVDYYVEFKSDE